MQNVSKVQKRKSEPAETEALEHSKYLKLLKKQKQLKKQKDSLKKN